MHFTYALARSSEFRKEIASCQGIPQTGLSLDDLPSGAKVSLNNKPRLVKMEVLVDTYYNLQSFYQLVRLNQCHVKTITKA